MDTLDLVTIGAVVLELTSSSSHQLVSNASAVVTCRDAINRELTKILIDAKKIDHMNLETADQVSKEVARCIIDNALKIAQETGKRKPKERKSRFTRELEREIGLIREVRDLLRN